MDLATTMKSLETAGSAQTRKTYLRHGAKEPVFGVLSATYKTLAKKIGHNQALARQLWETRNHDARILATMIADPKQTDSWLIDRWRHDLTNHILVDALAGLAETAEVSCDQIDRWCSAKDEWTGALGWGAFARRVQKPGGWSDEALARKLAIMERDIHRAPNRTRYAMNGALIAIGLRSPGMRTLALAAAERIGPVEIDHGDTGCKTPDAATYIMKVAGRQQARAGGKERSSAAKKPTIKGRRTKTAKGKNVAKVAAAKR